MQFVKVKVDAVINKDAKSIVKALELILDKYPEYTKSAKQWSHRFSWDKVIHQYQNCINDLA